MEELMQTILVCDDDKEIVEAIEIYLQQEGYHILKAYDGEEALEILLLTLHNYISFYLMMKIIPHLQQFFQTASRSSLIQNINRETAIKAVSLFCQLISQFIYFFPDGVHLSGHILYGLLYLSFPSFYQQSPL